MFKGLRRFALYGLLAGLLSLGLASEALAQIGFSIGTGRGGWGGFGPGYGRGFYGPGFGYGRGFYGGGYGFNRGFYGPGFYGSGVGITVGPRYSAPYYGGYGYYSSPAYSYSAPTYTYSAPAYSYSAPTYTYSRPATVAVPTESYQSLYPPTTTVTTPATPNNAALIHVRVPEGARVFFGNYEMAQQTGSMRHFSSPPLEPGYDYQYQVKAQWMQNGQPMEQTRDVTVKAGTRVQVDFMSGQHQHQGQGGAEVRHESDGGFQGQVNQPHQGHFQNQGQFHNQNQGQFSNQGQFNNQNQGQFSNQNRGQFNNQNPGQFNQNQGQFNNQNQSSPAATTPGQNNQRQNDSGSQSSSQTPRDF